MVDGGIAYGVDVPSAIHRCKEMVDDDSQIIVDIIVPSSPHLEGWADNNNALNNFMRFKGIKDFNKAMADVYDFFQAYPNVNFRYFVMPSSPLPGGLKLLDADNATNTWPMQV